MQAARKILALFCFLSMLVFCASELKAAGELTPALEILEKPRRSYSPQDIVSYKIRLHFSAAATESLRMKSPVPDFENLEFLGVSQETTASGSRESGSEQILTFRFQPLKTGKGAIRGIELKWVHEDGSEGPSVSIPPAAFTVRKPLPPYLKWIFFGLFAAAGSVISLGLVLRKKKKEMPPPPREKTLEEVMLAELQRLRDEMRRQKPPQFLDQLSKITESYLAQKLDWNRSRDGYNVLAQKAEGQWVKKDVQDLQEFFKQLEQLRFSGEAVSERELSRLCEMIYSLVSKKQIL